MATVTDAEGQLGVYAFDADMHTEASRRRTQHPYIPPHVMYIYGNPRTGGVNLARASLRCPTLGTARPL